MNRGTFFMLTEAARRYKCHNTQGKSITEAWTGLAYATDAKGALSNGYMRWVSKPHPRCLGWLQLTDKGAAIVQGWIDTEQIVIENYEITKYPPTPQEK